MLTIPYHRTQFTSRLTPSEFAERLKMITNRSGWVWSQADARFVGRVRADGFRLSYLSGGRNTYAPWIRGSIRPDGEGSAIDVRMSIHPVGGVVALAFLLFPIASARQAPVPAITMFFFMLGLHVVMYHIGFRSDALTAEMLLREVGSLQPVSASAAQ